MVTVAPAGFLVTVLPRRVSSRLSRSSKFWLNGTVGSVDRRKSGRAAKLETAGLPSMIWAPLPPSGMVRRLVTMASAVWTESLDQSVMVRAFVWKVVGFGG